MGLSDITKITKKRYIEKTTEIMTRKDLIDSLKERYRTIVVKGELADRLYDIMNGFSSGKKVMDELIEALKGEKALIQKFVRDYKLVSYEKGRAVLELKESKKGFRKHI